MLGGVREAAVVLPAHVGPGQEHKHLHPERDKGWTKRRENVNEKRLRDTERAQREEKRRGREDIEEIERETEKRKKGREERGGQKGERKS